MEKRRMSGASKITHELKVLGKGHMDKGLEKIFEEGRKAGIKEARESIFHFFTGAVGFYRKLRR